MTVRVFDEDTCQEIYESLLKRSRRSFEKYNRLRTLPRSKIPGELAFFLDNLLEHAAEFGIAPEEALAEVIDYGIIAWYTGLDKKARKRLDLPKIEDLRKKPGGKDSSKPESRNKADEPSATTPITQNAKMQTKKEHPKCSFPGCNKSRFVRGQGYCGKHWKQFKAGKIKSAGEYEKKEEQEKEAS
jgi:hypothetical protein